MSNFKGGWTGKKNPKYKHGWANTPTYATWRNMLSRCCNPKSKDWFQYGGRGIRVVKRWLKFENFLADMGKKPVGRTLDRKNNNGNYSAANCHWATKHQQLLNKRPRNVATYPRGKAHHLYGKKLSSWHRKKLSVGLKRWHQQRGKKVT